MSDYANLLRKNLYRCTNSFARQAQVFLPFSNPTFHNPEFQDAPYRVLIVRLSPFRDVDRSVPHLFLFQEIRRALPGAFIDVAFFPSAVERALSEQEGISCLIGVQSLRSADEFDLILISNAYTLELVNLPYLLIRCGFPLFSSQRGSEWPVLILGGSNAMATQSIIRQDGDCLVDGIFFGEGEGRVTRMLSLLVGTRGDKRAKLEQAALRIDGFWAAGSLRPVSKAVFCEPEARFLPVEYPLLNSPEVHTANLQITYGCPAFCAFCFEGYERKPYRELPLSDLLSIARQIKRAQGNEELNLYSFNLNTHQDILEMLLALHRLFERVSFKSQRVDILQRAGYLLEAEVEADKRSFSLGIEGISERQRVRLHKGLSTVDIMRLLERLFTLKIRKVKLFYVLTGHETAADVTEFRQFLKYLKGVRRSRNRGIRVIFGFGLLIRMPFTPLRYDRLFLDEGGWRPLIGQIKSACETNGFEFRLAFDWQAYCVAQVLALGGYWLVDPIVALAQRGHCFDAALSPGYWDELKRWMMMHGHWSDAFLGEKGPDYPFALAFVRSDISPEFLYRQYQEAQSGKDSGYCLGIGDQPGTCLGCGACLSVEQRETMVRHQIRLPDAGPYMASLRETMARKRRLQPVYYLVHLDPLLAGVLPEFLNAFVFKGILGRYPELVENLLAVRESLFTRRPNDDRFPLMSGETVFALKAWDADALQSALAKLLEYPSSGFQIVGPADGFTPGAFTRMHLDVHLPVDLFPEPRRALEQYLREAYLPYSLRRDGPHPGRRGRYRFQVPSKGIKKRILFGGFFETTEGGFHASLDVGSKFNLRALLRTFGRQNLSRHAKAHVSKLEW